MSQLCPELVSRPVPNGQCRAIPRPLPAAYAHHVTDGSRSIPARFTLFSLLSLRLSGPIGFPLVFFLYSSLFPSCPTCRALECLVLASLFTSAIAFPFFVSFFFRQEANVVSSSNVGANRKMAERTREIAGSSAYCISALGNEAQSAAALDLIIPPFFTVSTISAGTS